MAHTRDLLIKYMTGCFIETGTGSGNGVAAALDAGFSEVISIEAIASSANQAMERFKNDNVTIYNGLSENVLSDVLSRIEDPVTIFFDAHYSGPGAYMGATFSPLMEELEAVKNHEVKNHILLIDDPNLFGRPELPNLDLEKVKKKVLEINDKYVISNLGNLLVCEAPATPSIKIARLDQMQVDNIYPYIEKLLKTIEKPVFFEVGAANGEDTAKISAINPNVDYYAFEPDTRNLAALKSKNLKINIIESAIGSYNGKTIFYMSSGTNPTFGYDHTFSSSTKRPKKHLEVFPWCKFDKIVNANICTLDKFCFERRIKHIDFLWVDIQGAEQELIKGAKNILNRVGYLYLEYSDTKMYDGQLSYDQLIDLVKGRFEVVHKFSGDVLLRNKKLT